MFKDPCKRCLVRSACHEPCKKASKINTRIDVFASLIACLTCFGLFNIFALLLHCFNLLNFLNNTLHSTINFLLFILFMIISTIAIIPFVFKKIRSYYTHLNEKIKEGEWELIYK